jgi:formate dehydrogenase iron-sulfur subunit
LIAQAHAQIESNPHRYIDHVYGEHEVGGTSMLYLSAVPFEQLGFPTLGDRATPEDAITIMERTPVVAATAAAIATSLFFITKRHQEIVEAQTVKANDHEAKVKSHDQGVQR